MFRQLLTRLGSTALLACSATAAHAGGTALFATTNVEYLYGTSYQDIVNGEDDKASIITIEHFDVWKYGDNFLFVDITNPDREGDVTGPGAKGYASYYAELSPRLSIGKTFFGKELAFGPFSDVLLTSTLEIPDGLEQVYLYGVAADLKLPLGSFFQTNLYVRDNQDSHVGDGYQVTFAWGFPIKAGSLLFQFEGFFDYAFDQKGLEDNIITAPRFLLDLGQFFGKPGCLQAGVEWQFWNNKFGIKNTLDGSGKSNNESVPQAMIKWFID